MPRPWLDRITGRPKAPRIYLHIGAMKTGTTFLQGLMSANQEALGRAGYLFPGEKWAEQSLAVRDVMFDSEDPRLRALVDGQWDKMLDAIRHLGVKDIDMPTTPYRVWTAIQNASGHAGRADEANVASPGAGLGSTARDMPEGGNL